MRGDYYWSSTTALYTAGSAVLTSMGNGEVRLDSKADTAYAWPVRGGTIGPFTEYADAEDGSTTGWDVYVNVPAGATITNVFDAGRNSRVIQLSGAGTGNGYRLRSKNLSNWGNASQFVIQWSMKYNEYFMIFADVETTLGQRYLMYTPVNESTLGTGQYVRHGLGAGVADGTWRTFVRDLQADLRAAQPTARITKVRRSEPVCRDDGLAAIEGEPWHRSKYSFGRGASGSGSVMDDALKPVS